MQQDNWKDCLINVFVMGEEEGGGGLGQERSGVILLFVCALHPNSVK